MSREIQENYGIAARQPLLHRPAEVPVHDPLVTFHELGDLFAPDIFWWLIPPRTPVMIIKVYYGQTRDVAKTAGEDGFSAPLEPTIRTFFTGICYDGISQLVPSGGSSRFGMVALDEPKGLLRCQ